MINRLTYHLYLDSNGEITRVKAEDSAGYPFEAWTPIAFRTPLLFAMKTDYDRLIIHAPKTARTVPGIGPGRWDSGKLAREQEAKAQRKQLPYLQTHTEREQQRRYARPLDEGFVYRLYTERRNDANLFELVTRYFEGATITYGAGVWQGNEETAAVIEILGTVADRQRIFDLAGDIRVVNQQTSVIVTWSPVSRFDVTEAAINQGAL